MPRVLHIVITLDPANGGPAEGVIQLGEAWRRLGIVQDVLTFDPPGSAHCARYDGKVFALGRGRQGRLAQFFADPAAVREMREIAAGYDAVLVSALWDPAAVAARRALQGISIPYFVFTHGSLDPWFRRTYPVKHMFKQISWLMTQAPLLSGATRVLFTTNAERDGAHRQFLPWNMASAVVGYGTGLPRLDPAVQIPAFRAAMPELGDRSFLLFLSRVHEKKGCDDLIEGFARNTQTYDGDLVIAGPGEPALLAQLRARAAALGLSDRVHFPGLLLGAAKWGAFQACDAFTLSSHTENFGVAVVEAMACAKPVLISDKVNISQEIEIDGAGFVADDNPEGAASVIRRFVALTHAEREAMGERAQQSFHQRFEASRFALQLAEVILPGAPDPL